MERQRNLKVGDIVLVQTKHKLGKNSYRMARVTQTFLDEAGLCRRVKLEARPRGGPLGLPYIPKNLETFKMATQRLVLLHPHEAEILTKGDLSFNQLNEDLENKVAENEDVENEDPDNAKEKVPDNAQENVPVITTENVIACTKEKVPDSNQEDSPTTDSNYISNQFT